jgi:hypothetical protein
LIKNSRLKHCCKMQNAKCKILETNRTVRNHTSLSNCTTPTPTMVNFVTILLAVMQNEISNVNHQAARKTNKLHRWWGWAWQWQWQELRGGQWECRLALHTAIM